MRICTSQSPFHSNQNIINKFNKFDMVKKRYYADNRVYCYIYILQHEKKEYYQTVGLSQFNFP